MYEDAIAAAAAAAPQFEAPTPEVPGLELHVDGDYLAYFASGNDETEPGEARLNANKRIEAFRAKAGATSVVVHNTAPGCQKGERYLIATVKPYQGQRDTGRKPKNHAFLQKYLMEYSGALFRSKTWPTREADDGIAACAHFGVGKQPGYIAIATADKDLRMLPGLHVDWQTRELVRVLPGAYDVVGEPYPGRKNGAAIMKPGKQYGLKFFFMQLLMGDAADNCPGLPERRDYDTRDNPVYKKIGEKGAADLLERMPDVASAAERVCRLYFENYHRTAKWPQDRSPALTEWADRLAEQAALMWMRCDLHASITDFADHKGHSVIPWPSEIYDAAQRLKERVTLARTALNNAGSSNDTQCPDRIAA